MQPDWKNWGTPKITQLKSCRNRNQLCSFQAKYRCISKAMTFTSHYSTEKILSGCLPQILTAKLKSTASWQNQRGCAPSKDSDQPGHPPSLIRVFAVRMKEAWVLSYPLSTQWRLWWDWADAQDDLSLCWAHSHFVGFVTRWLKS